MTTLLVLGIIAALTVGFGLSWILVGTGLKIQNRALRKIAFVLVGNVLTVLVMTMAVFLVWPGGGL